MKRNVSIILFISALIGLAGTGYADTLLIHIDIFSGRENPVCTLTDAASVSMIRSRLSRYHPASSVYQPTSDCNCRGGLGYRGIMVRPPGAWDKGPVYVLCNAKLFYHSAYNSSKRWCYRDPRSEMERLVLSAGIRADLTATDHYGTLRFADLVPDSIRASLCTFGIVTWEVFSDLRIDFSVLHHSGPLARLPSSQFMGPPDLTCSRRPFPYPMDAPGGIAVVKSNPFFSNRFAGFLTAKDADSLLPLFRKWLGQIKPDSLNLTYRAQAKLELGPVSYTLKTTEGYRAWLVPLADLPTAVPRHVFLWACDAGDCIGNQKADTSEATATKLLDKPIRTKRGAFNSYNVLGRSVFSQQRVSRRVARRFSGVRNFHVVF